MKVLVFGNSGSGSRLFDAHQGAKMEFTAVPDVAGTADQIIRTRAAIGSADRKFMQLLVWLIAPVAIVGFLAGEVVVRVRARRKA